MNEEEIEFYGDPNIASKDAPIPAFLKWTYLILPFWGIATFYLFWNGSIAGWFDPTHWQQLQIAANTTFPAQNQSMPNQQNIPLNQQQKEHIQQELE